MRLIERRALRVARGNGCGKVLRGDGGAEGVEGGSGGVYGGSSGVEERTRVDPGARGSSGGNGARLRWWLR